MRTLFFYVLFLLFTTAYAQPSGTVSTGTGYFSQLPPGSAPTLFAPNKISDEFGNRDMAISPAGDELFFTNQYGRGLISVLMHSKRVKGIWSNPEVASFSGLYSDMEPVFSFDGTKLFFVSNRTLTNIGGPKDYDIWYVTKRNGEWVNPRNPGAPVNSEKDEFYPSFTKRGDIYFTRAAPGRQEDIFFCKLTDTGYGLALPLPDVINSPNDEFNAFIDPDERFLLFSVYGRKDDNGGGDLYISRKNENGDWMQAKNLGLPVNSSFLDYCPYVTRDKKYLFFTSNRHQIKIPFEKSQNSRSLRNLLHSPLNGFDNIYWIRAAEILK